MITCIKIDNVMNKETATKKIKKLQKVTEGNYHNFEYLVCPIGGSFDIMLQSDYEFDGETQQEQEREMLEFFNFMLVDAYCK